MIKTKHKSRHFRSEFSQLEYDKWSKSTWSLPSAFGEFEDRGVSTLARWRKLGGDGVSAILPILGIISCSKAHANFALSVQEISRLVSLDPATVTRAVDVLAEDEVVSRRVGVRHGQFLSHWSVSTDLCGGRESGDSNYFSFAMRMIYGGVWAMMPRVQRAIYLAAATRATLVKASTPEDHWLFRELLHPYAKADDIRDFVNTSNGGAHLRLAALTQTELRRRSGIPERTLSDHVAALRAPEGWSPFGGPFGDELKLTFSPLTIYPTTHRTLLFFFRDHVPHLPWEFLNDVDRDEIWRHGGAELAQLLAA